MNLPISNVPGPRERGRICGAMISEIYSVGPLMPGSGINITVWSYVDHLNISVLTDDLTLGDPHEATDAMIHALTKYEVSGELNEVRTAMPRTAGV
jgi:diacylglycerol O-acyltransferase